MTNSAQSPPIHRPWLVLMALVSACSEPPSPAAENIPAPSTSRLPNVLLVVLDTVRADHVSCYGYGRPTTPALDAFAAGARRFTRAFSSAPWTLPSHASMFTGLDPTQHRVQTLVAKDHPSGPKVGVRPLRERFFTLAEGLSELGYRTGAFIANHAYLQPEYGLSQGFETYRTEHQPGLLLNDDAFQWLDQEDPRPWFLFINYMDAHRPYVSLPRPDVVPEPVDRNGTALLDRLIAEVMPGEGAGHLDAELAQSVIDQYDLGLASADEALGRLLEHIAARPDGAGTLVAVTSDHGEYFGEHYLVEHSKDVYQPALWVPLVIGVLDRPQAALDQRSVLSSDLPDLLLSASSHPTLNELRQRFDRGRRERSPLIYNGYARERDVRDPVWGHRFLRERHVTIDWPHKFIESSDGRHELYDLERDPGESNNLFTSEPELAEGLRTRLQEALARGGKPSGPDAQPPEMSEEQRARMRALGYAE